MGTKERVEILNTNDSVINKLLKRISNLEFEVERLEERLKIYESDSSTVVMLEEDYSKMKKEIERLHSIIREVRDYIEEVYKRNEEGTDNIWILDFYKITEILEGSDKKNDITIRLL